MEASCAYHSWYANFAAHLHLATKHSGRLCANTCVKERKSAPTQQERYHSLTRKTHTFFKTVLRLYDPQYLMKVDDDVFVQLPRLPLLTAQYNHMHKGTGTTSSHPAASHHILLYGTLLPSFPHADTCCSCKKKENANATQKRIVPLVQAPLRTTPRPTDYIGCYMYNTKVLTNPEGSLGHWAEPQHTTLGTRYVSYVRGSTYVLSRKALHLIAAVPPHGLRYFRSEGVRF